MLKYSFMTFACPEYSLKEVIETAVRHGYDGVEPRVVQGHKHGIELELSEADRASVRRQFQDAGVDVACIATSVCFNQPEQSQRDQMVVLAKEYCELAADLRCQCIRVFGGRAADNPDRKTAIKRVISCLRECEEIAGDCGVCICLETHDYFSAGADVAAVCSVIDSPWIRAAWDTQHPVTVGEDLAVTASFLMPYVRHVHFHDVDRTDGKNECAPIGEGQEPMARFLSVFKKHDYEGFLSGEWFYNHGPENDLAHYITALKAIEETL